jgi:hypothetical protein
MSLIVFLSLGASTTVTYELNESALTAVSVDGNNSLVFFFRDWPANTTNSLVSVFLFPVDPMPSSVLMFSSASMAAITLTEPFFVYDHPARAMLALYFVTAMNFSVWTFERPLCDSHVSVFGGSGAARFRLNYNADEARRCFFMVDTSTNNSFDYFVRSDSHHALPTLSVYTNSSITNSSAWIQQTDDVSKQLADKPIFFAVEGVPPRSQWALNINFSHTDPGLADACLFKASPFFNGTNMAASDDKHLNHQTQCRIPSRVMMWMYIWYTLFAGGSIAIIAFVGYWKFRQWQAEEVLVPSRMDYQPVFGKQASTRGTIRQDRTFEANAGGP